MDVVVALEFSFYRTPDGKVFSQNIFGYSFWQRYLEAFERIKIGAAVHNVASVPDNWVRADGDDVVFTDLPHHPVFLRYLVNRGKLKRTARLLLNGGNAVILRVPTIIANIFIPLLRQTGQPYGLEVTTDPHGFYSPGSIEHPLRPLIRGYFTHHLRKQCAGAYATAYATKNVLQARYPPGGLTTHYSNVELSKSDIVTEQYNAGKYDQKSYRIIFVGNLLNFVKAPDVLLKAVSLCVQRGKNIQLYMIGDGQKRTEVEKIAEDLSLSNRVNFLGNVSSKKAIFEELDKSDLFVLPSRTETIPRAMVEAMARGLPSIGSQVGGIPELLAREDLFPPDNECALADKIIEVLSDSDRMSRMSARNIETAGNYCNEVLDKKRIEFFLWIKNATGKWLKKK